MKITLLQVGKTEEKHLLDGIEKYESRLKHYCKFQIITIPALKNTKNLKTGEQKKKEAELILKNIQNGDIVVLLDEKGKDYSSVQFAGQIEKFQTRGIQHLIFIIGGPYGFDASIYERAQELYSLSKMTFSHQMVRLFFIEQLYRAFSIINGEPYHHQ